MKKSILATLIALSFGFAINASAATGDIIPFQTSTTVVPADSCSILSQRATLNASADVHAAYQCLAGARLAIAGTCHTGGSISVRTVECQCTDTSLSGEPAWTSSSTNNSQCSCGAAGATDEGVPSPVSVEVSGPQAFAGSSNGGSIGSYEVDSGGTGVCDATTIVAITAFQ